MSGKTQHILAFLVVDLLGGGKSKEEEEEKEEEKETQLPPRCKPF